MSTADRDDRDDDLGPDTGPDTGPTADELRDEHPADLDHAAFVGAYQFPDNSRRRIPGTISLVLAAVCLVLYLTLRDAR